jgi:Family of unknown function (DUF6588)
MKKNRLFLSCIFFIISLNAIGQNVANTEFVKGSISDAGKLARAYLEPLEKSLNAAGSQGMVVFYPFNNSELKLSIGLSLTTVFVPNSSKTFDVNDLALEKLKASDPNLSIAQTFSGNSSAIFLETIGTYKTAQTSYPFYKDVPLFKLSSMPGQKNSITWPLLSLTASVDRWNFTLRGLPNLKVLDNTIGVHSIGAFVQTNFMRIEGVSAKNDLHIDFVSGFQYSGISYFPGIEPDESKIGISLQSNNGPYDDQFLKINSFSIPIKLVFLQKMDKLFLFGGLGYDFWFSRVKLKGKYPVYLADPTNTFEVVVKDFEDPLSYEQSAKGFSADLGIGYQFTRIEFISSFGLSSYNTVNIGAKYYFSLRKN